RLQIEFDGRVAPRTVRRTVQRSRRDLIGAPEGALPELVERLARARLLAGPSGHLQRPPDRPAAAPHAG
ncbi:MAG: hypothetical protein AVDCRST_MAG66-4794, partial [uncultured Pseudonocardia sp.]